MKFKIQFNCFYILILFLLCSCKSQKQPQNVILMIGDGMGLAQISAANFTKEGGLSILNNALIVGMHKSQSSSDFITDSAAGATAFASGQKTFNGALGKNKDSIDIKTLVEEAEEKKLSTALVVTCSITHATPAAFYAHQVSRNSHQAIANQLYGSGVDVFIGGGLQYFNSRQLEKFGYSVVRGIKNIQSFPGKNKLAGFYSDSIHPIKMSEGRGNFLQEASMKAIQLISSNKKGFFMMIEGSQIDWGGHDSDAAYTVSETIDFDNTFQKVLDWAKKDKNTLVIVTADHETGGMALTGYDKINNKPELKYISNEHTGILIPVFAYGPGAKAFSGVYENTEIYYKIKKLLLK